MSDVLLYKPNLGYLAAAACPALPRWLVPLKYGFSQKHTENRLQPRHGPPIVFMLGAMVRNPIQIYSCGCLPVMANSSNTACIMVVRELVVKIK